VLVVVARITSLSLPDRGIGVGWGALTAGPAATPVREGLAAEIGDGFVAPGEIGVVVVVGGAGGEGAAGT
jgi:hypothetical protein